MLKNRVLDEQKVLRVFDHAWVKDPSDVAAEEIKDIILVDGVMYAAYINSDKAEQYGQDIAQMLGELPLAFQPVDRGGSGDASFLESTYTREGVQWTNRQEVAERLLILGIAIGKAECCSDRSTWCMLPGGAPYFRVL